MDAELRRRSQKCTEVLGNLGKSFGNVGKFSGMLMLGKLSGALGTFPEIQRSLPRFMEVSENLRTCTWNLAKASGI